MHEIYASNVDEAYCRGMKFLSDIGEPESSRAGSVIVSPIPVMTIYGFPTHRVLFNENRDANPFFHFFEGLWMLGGYQDAKFLDMFVSDFTSRFADDGTIQHGAYGWRWARHFEFNQLNSCIDLLRCEPTTRRAVLTMWDPLYDLNVNKKDLPCNTHIYFRNREGYLDMMVCCRSNDIIWGAYGANVVHMSMLMEYVAVAVGIKLGKYFQMSFNFHAYENIFRTLMHDYRIQENEGIPLTGGYPPTVKLVEEPETFREECRSVIHFAERGLWKDDTKYKNSIFPDTAWPMFAAHSLYKEKKLDEALMMAGTIVAPDWNEACSRWIQRRIDRRELRRDAGEINYGDGQ